MLYKLKKRGVVKGNRILISVTFLGSPGPIRFVANEGDLVAAVIDTALKCYAREGRLPILGSDFNDFIFYCPMVGPEGEINLSSIYISNCFYCDNNVEFFFYYFFKCLCSSESMGSSWVVGSEELRAV